MSIDHSRFRVAVAHVRADLIQADVLHCEVTCERVTQPVDGYPRRQPGSPANGSKRFAGIIAIAVFTLASCAGNEKKPPVNAVWPEGLRYASVHWDRSAIPVLDLKDLSSCGADVNRPLVKVQPFPSDRKQLYRPKLRPKRED